MSNVNASDRRSLNDFGLAAEIALYGADAYHVSRYVTNFLIVSCTGLISFLLTNGTEEIGLHYSTILTVSLIFVILIFVFKPTANLFTGLYFPAEIIRLVLGLLIVLISCWAIIPQFDAARAIPPTWMVAWLIFATIGFVLCRICRRYRSGILDEVGAKMLVCRDLGAPQQIWDQMPEEWRKVFTNARSVGFEDISEMGALENDLRSGAIEQVILYTGTSDQNTVDKTAFWFTKFPVDIYVIPKLDGFGAKFRLGARMPVYALTRHHIGRPWHDLKRIYETLIALILFVFSLPLCLFIAALIKLDSPGPVFFQQTRRGYNHKPFTMYKFRTMQVPANSGVAPSQQRHKGQTQANDARVTRVGRWLRRSSMDELPQLLNVLKGDMALVGPRPHALDSCVFDVNFADVADDYCARYNVRPGITGLAQINDLRGPITSPEAMRARIDADLKYIHRWTVCLDFLILLRTISAVSRGENAR